MPIYEYDCPNCGRVEVIQKVSEASSEKPIDCPNENCTCKAQMVISASAFHLKGSGWYKTDYTSGSSSTGGASKSSSASKASSGAAEAKSEGGSTEKKSLKTTGGCGSGCGCH